MVLDPLGSILRKVEIAGPDRSGANQLFAVRFPRIGFHNGGEPMNEIFPPKGSAKDKLRRIKPGVEDKAVLNHQLDQFGLQGRRFALPAGAHFRF